MELEQSHTFSDQEARERVRALADYLSARHGLNVSWAPDGSAKVSGSYKIVSIDVCVALEPGKVRVSGKDPGFLWRLPAKTYVSSKLAKYLSPSEAVDKLPRR